MLKQRIFTALAMVAVLLVLLLTLSPLWFSLVIMLLVVVAGWEWTNLIKVDSSSGKAGYLVALLAVLLTTGYWLGLFGAFDFGLAQSISYWAVGLWAVIFLWVQGYPSSAILWSPKLVLIALGILLLTFTWVAVATILHAEQGRWLLLLAIVVVALADIGGYLAGRLFGKHKLAPVVSPGKTWEGFVGGIFLELVLIATLLWLNLGQTLSALLILIIPVALYSVLGDLFESMIKRHSGVKDSSQLLPGHGGVLDRIDGFMAALPLFSLLLIQTSPF